MVTFLNDLETLMKEEKRINEELVVIKEKIRRVLRTEIMPEIERTCSGLHEEHRDKRKSMKDRIQSNWADILSILQADYGVARVTVDTFLLPLPTFTTDEMAETVTFYVSAEGYVRFMKKKFQKPLEWAIEDVSGFRCRVFFLSGESETISREPNQCYNHAMT